MFGWRKLDKSAISLRNSETNLADRLSARMILMAKIEPLKKAGQGLHQTDS
eukprot:SAG31_NODE_332_length_17516_cov_3.552840_16_plen_51_part_00